MRLLYLCYSRQSGVIASLSKELRQRGHEVIIGDVGTGVKPPHISPATLYLTSVALLRFRRAWLYFYFDTVTAFDTMSKKAESMLVQTKPEAVLQSGCLFGIQNPQVPYMLYLDHTRAISMACASWPGLPRPPAIDSAWLARERATYQRADRILTMSAFVRNSLVLDYDVNHSKVQVVGAGPVLPALPNISGQEDDGFTVLFVGLNFKGKGGPVLLSAMKRVRQAVPHSRLLVAGVSGRSTKDVVYLGRIPPDQIGTCYRSATVFAMPTLREAFGLVFLEAMAYGLPCVGTNVEAVPEIIIDGKTGYVVPPGDDETLADRLIQLLKDPALRRRMGEAGRARLERHFTWQRVADALEASLHCRL